MFSATLLNRTKSAEDPLGIAAEFPDKVVGERLLIWGDTVHVPEIQVEQPDVTMEFDIDPKAAAAMRRYVFDLAVSDGLLIGGMHLHFPGFGRMAERAGRYILVPEPWAFEL